MSYDVGDTVALAIEVKDSTGALADAALVTFTVTLPDDSTTSFSTATPGQVNHPSVGRYDVAYLPAQIGKYHWRAVATVPNVSYSDTFDVRSATLALMSLADARASVKLPLADTSKDETLRDYIDAVAAVIEDLWGSVVPRTHTELHAGGAAAILLNHRPVISITSVTEYTGSTPTVVAQAATPDVVASAGGYTFDASTGILTRRTAGGRDTAFLGEVWVTYVAGVRQVPGNVLLAARELLRHFWQFGMQAGRPQLGSPGGGDDGNIYIAGYAVPRRVVQLLGDSHRLPGIG